MRRGVQAGRVSRYSGHDISCVRIAYPKHDTRTISGSSMSQGFAPFYDVNRTYEDNYLQGPFGAFAEVMKGDSAAGASAQSAQTTQSQSSDQAEEFLGFRVNLPFGFPAGPLLNERFTTAAFRMGFRFGGVQDGPLPRVGLQRLPERARRASEERRRVAGSRQRRTG